MQFLDRINAIEQRAARVNLSLWQLCRDAGVDYSIIHRWKNSEMSPNVATLDRHLGRLEEKLAEIETKILRELTEAAQAATAPAEPVHPV